MTHRSAEANSLQWLDRAERFGTEAADALSVFRGLPSPQLSDIIGRWRGTGVHTGHILDGMLESYDWFGKEFVSEDVVFPLLFGTSSPEPVAIDPRYLPLNRFTASVQRMPIVKMAFRIGRAALQTRQSSARLRRIAYDGTDGLAMVYDSQPIIDHFRLVTPDCMIGLMDCRGFSPLFFTLRKVPAR